MNKKRVIYLSVVFLISILINSFIFFEDLCVYLIFYHQNKLYAIYLVLLIILGAIYTKINKSEVGSAVLYILFLSFGLFGFHHTLLSRVEDRLLEDEYKITYAIINDKRYKKRGYHVHYFFRHKKTKAFSFDEIGRNEGDRLKIGDTILVKYSPNCLYLSKVYNFFPKSTKQEKKKKRNFWNWR